ncbi:MAG: ribonuclease III [Synechococcales cyanobacterium T60_A2020_003]|nr:ribonuclease III [Synechococcales cyanobacterium T60_A2020_003]
MVGLPEFDDEALLKQALTHRSFVNEHPSAGQDNERLEFLGDAVLNFLSGELLYKRYPDKPEGELTALRSALVDEKQLSEFAIAVGLDQPNVMRLGRGAERDGGRQNRNLLSSTFEAIIGAYFLDQNSNVDPVRAYMLLLFESVVDDLALLVPSVNFKSRFQEWALAKLGENPRYVIVNQTGPDHAREYTSEVQVARQSFGQGTGRRKQDAEKAAAKAALESLGLL